MSTRYTTFGIEFINEENQRLWISKTDTDQKVSLWVEAGERMATIKVGQQVVDELHEWLSQLVSQPEVAIGPPEGRLGRKYADHPFTEKSIKTNYTGDNTCQWVVADYGPSYEICARPASHHRG